MSKKKVVIGSVLAILLGLVAIVAVDAYLDVKDLDFGFDEEDIFGM